MRVELGTIILMLKVADMYAKRKGVEWKNPLKFKIPSKN